MIRGLPGLGRVAGLVAFLAAAPPGAAQLPGTPLFEIDRDGVLTVVSLPEPLSRREVRPHLGSGLTTSFVVEVEARDGRGRSVRGAGRIEIRYELWDEVYLVRKVGVGGASALRPVRTLEELQTAWRQLRLPVASVRSLDRTAGPWTVEVGLSVVPFSQSEQRSAQRWVSDSIAGGGPSAAAPSGPRAGEATTGGVLDLFLGSSIQRRSLVRYDWKVTFRPEAGP